MVGIERMPFSPQQGCHLESTCFAAIRMISHPLNRPQANILHGMPFNTTFLSTVLPFLPRKLFLQLPFPTPLNK